MAGQQRMGASLAASMNQQMVKTEMRAQVLRLEKTLVKYNDVLGENAILRQVRARSAVVAPRRTRLRRMEAIFPCALALQGINDLRNERLIFDAAFEKLGVELQEHKDVISGIKKGMEEEYRARDAAQRDMSVLASERAQEKADFCDRWADLSTTLDALGEAQHRWDSVGPATAAGMRDLRTSECDTRLVRSAGSWGKGGFHSPSRACTRP